jgi:hypothetical protein
MTLELNMKSFEGFEELSAEEMYEVEGGFDVAKFVIQAMIGGAIWDAAKSGYSYYTTNIYQPYIAPYNPFAQYVNPTGRIYY